MAAMRACAVAALLLCIAAAQEAEEHAPVADHEQDLGDVNTVDLKPWLADSSVRGLEEQLSSSVTSLATKQKRQADTKELYASSLANTETEQSAMDSEAESKPELEMFTGPKNARVVGKIPPGLPLPSLQVVQHGRLVIVIYHLGGKHTTGVEHHFVLEFEPVKPGTAQYSAKDGSFSYTVPRPQPYRGGAMQHVPVSVEKDQASKNKKSNWKEAKTPDGKTYYYNTVTRKTVWTKPSLLMSVDDSQVVSTASLRATSASSASLPKSLEMKESPTGAEIVGVLPTGLPSKSLQVLQWDRQIIVTYQVGGDSGNIGVEQRFVLNFEPLSLGKAKYADGSGKFAFTVEKPKPLKGGAALHIPVKLSSGPPSPPKKLLQLKAELKDAAPIA